MNSVELDIFERKSDWSDERIISYMTVKLKMGTITELISIKIKFLFIIDDSHFDFR